MLAVNESETNSEERKANITEKAKSDTGRRKRKA